MSKQDRTVDSASLRSLMSLIGDAESNANYDAYFGNSANTTVRLTEKTISEVIDWQTRYVQNGSPSSAVGKYQFLNSTLIDLVSETGLDASQLFDSNAQDALAITLIHRRGATDYVNGRITADKFAANLAKEWAALPTVMGENPQSSYYDSDGLNKSRVSVDELLQAIKPIKASQA